MRRMRLLALLLVLTVLATACSGLGRLTDNEPTTVTAIFPTTNNLFDGSEVRILGLRVGRVLSIEPTGESVRVELEIEPGRELPADLRAELKPTSLLGERFVQLSPPYTGGPTFASGGEIPLSRTAVPVDVDQVLRSFENFLRSLDSAVLADLIDSLADTFAGQGEGINELLEGGSETVRVLADSSEDLNALVSEFAALNETLATRDQVIGRTLDRFSVVFRTLVEEKEQIIASVANLRRLTIELRPLLDDHTEPLIVDLEVLATTLSTVERNLERVGLTIQGGRTLFEGAGRAFEYETGRLALNNQTGMLGQAIGLRVTDRLVGLCLRLEVPECSTAEFFEPLIGALLCQEGPSCLENQALMSRYLSDALSTLPPEVMDALVTEAQAGQREAPPAAEPVPAPAPEAAAPAPTLPTLPGPGSSRLPLPDPRLSDDAEDAEGGLNLFRRPSGGDR